MKRAIVVAVLASGLSVGASVAPAFASITCTNPSGNHPQGQCNGQAVSEQNPAGHAPPGQQP